MSKEKMSTEKKLKLIYSGELLFFGILFIVLATLEILGLIGKRSLMMTIFNWVTIFGGTWMLVDFFWVLFSKKRRKKNSLLDKALLIPAGIYLIVFDSLCFAGFFPVSEEAGMAMRRLFMGILFYYLGAIYIFQSVYHYFFPVPSLVEAIEQAKQEETQELPVVNEDEEMIDRFKEKQEDKKEEPHD